MYPVHLSRQKLASSVFIRVLCAVWSKGTRTMSHIQSFCNWCTAVWEHWQCSQLMQSNNTTGASDNQVSSFAEIIAGLCILSDDPLLLPKYLSYGMSILRLKEMFLSWTRWLILLFIRPRVQQGGDRQLLGQSGKEELGATPSKPVAGVSMMGQACVN